MKRRRSCRRNTKGRHQSLLGVAIGNEISARLELQALEDLRAYREFAYEHEDGRENSTPVSMTEVEKRIAQDLEPEQ